MMQVYKRLAEKHGTLQGYNLKFTYVPMWPPIERYRPIPDLCTAELTTFLKETNNGTAT